MGQSCILLIRANTLDGVNEFLSHRAVCPPLGLMYLAAVLRERRPHDYRLRILDPGLEGMGVGDLGRVVAEERPALIGISALAVELPAVEAILREASRVAPGVPIVVGGPCSQTRPRELASRPEVACCVQGEGEETFAEIVPRLLAGENVAGTPGAFARGPDGAVVDGGPRPPIAELDAMPMAAWDLIELPRYSQKLSMNYGPLAGRPYAPVFTSRGCPWRCSYCHNLFGKRVRSRSPENVLAEMAYLVGRHGVREFHFYDDIFNIDMGRATRIVDGIAERDWNVKLAFPNGVRSDLLTPEFLRSCRRAGTYLMCFAIETATPRLQRMIHKNLDLEKAAAAIRVARDEGIIPLGFFMLGFPGETAAELRATINWACRSSLLKAFFFAVTPYEGTPIADAIRERNPGFRIDPATSYHFGRSYYEHETGVNIYWHQAEAYIRFYLNPIRFATFFYRYPGKLTFLRNFLRGLLYLSPGLRRCLRA